MQLFGLAVVLTLGLVLAPLNFEAQQSGKTYRIGWLAYGWTERAERTSPKFVHELKKHSHGASAPPLLLV
jgi:ABC-type long-subunit fatty acid transport system fused permease/ATPase subunit